MKHTALAIFAAACFLGGFVVGIKCALYVEEHGHAPADPQPIHAPARPGPRPTPEPMPRVHTTLSI